MDDAMELMRARHSVRQYLDRPIPEEIRKQLDHYAEELNEAGHLHIQIIYNEPECFNTRMAHYGKFENCRNYISVVGEKTADLEERAGYYGERLVLKAQELGLNTCWVALTHGKSKAVIADGETEVILISLGYGKTQGIPSKNKPAEAVSDLTEDSPEWYKRGIEAALLAPTAINQQKFSFRRDGRNVTARAGRFGPYVKTDLGIVKCHFELGAGTENFEWK